MGLTHYWKRPTELPSEAFAAAVRDVRKVSEGANVSLSGFSGEGEPIIQPDKIVFNGAMPTNVEPFEIHLTEFDRRGRNVFWSSCKTEGLPYDIAVKATLIILKHHLDDRLIVTSDVTSDDWNDARRLCQYVLGYGDVFLLNRKDDVSDE